MKERYEKRLTALRKYMDEHKLDVAMITTPKNIFYYTGFHAEPYERFMALIVHQEQDKTYLFVPALDKEMALDHSYVKTVVTVSDEENPYERLKDEIGNRFRTFGIEKQKVTLDQYEQLTHWIEVENVLDMTEFIIKERMLKTEEECHLVQKAIHCIEQVLHDGIKQVKVGMSELELTAEFEYLMRKSGAEGPAFSTTVLSGENAALPHGSPGARTFKKGDFLLIDMGVVVGGYCSDISRTFVIGEETEEQKKIYETVSEATKRAIQATKRGAPIGEIDRAARSFIEEKGYGAYFNNRVGHGLGIDVHEQPSIHSENSLKVAEGFLFTIEPGIYIPQFGGVRIEENIYIGDDGKTNVLTSYPSDLIRLG